MFDPDWLIPKCMTQMQKHPFYSSGRPDAIPFFMHALGLFPACEAYCLLFRAQSIRASSAFSKP